MAALIEAFDWPAAPLGKPDHWPQSLRSALSICLNIPHPAAIYWGPESILLYNDAYSAFLGDKHPWALGQPAHQVWPEIWDLLGARFAKVTGGGEAICFGDEPLPVHRHGFTGERYFNFAVSPIRGEVDLVAGIFNTVAETTCRVIGERRARLLRRLEEGLTAARTTDEVCKAAVELLTGGAWDVPFCLIYRVTGEPGARHLELVAAAGMASGTAASPLSLGLNGAEANAGSWPFKRVLETGKLEIVEELSARFGMAFPSGAWPESVRSAAMIPIHLSPAEKEGSNGCLILGINPRQAFDDAYRSFTDAIVSHLKDAFARVQAGAGDRRQSEEYRTIVDFALNCVHESAFLIDSSGHFLYVNREATRSLGYTQVELLSMGVPDIDPDFPPERWSRHWSEVAKEGSRTFESRQKAKDGRIFPVEINSNYFKYDGRLYSMALAHDISERKRAEEELRAAGEQRAILELALNNVHEAAFLVDKDLHFLYVNGEATRALGYSRQELLGKRVADIDPDFPPERWPSYWSEVQKERILSFETRHKTKSGRVFPVELVSNYFEHGGRSYVMGLARDIGERKRAEEELRQTTAELDRFFTLSRDLFCIASADGYFLKLNPAWEQTLGYTLAELQDRPFYEFVHSEDTASTRRAAGQLIAGKEVITFQNRHRCKDGSYRWLEWRATAAGGQIYAAARDITRQKQREDERLAHLKFFECMDRINRAMQGKNDLEEMMNQVLGVVLDTFGADRTFLVHPLDPDASFLRVHAERTKPEYPGAAAKGVTEFPASEGTARRFRSILAASGPVQMSKSELLDSELAKRFNMQSQMSLALYPKAGQAMVIWASAMLASAHLDAR